MKWLPVGEDLVYVSIEIPVCPTRGEPYYDRRTCGIWSR